MVARGGVITEKKTGGKSEKKISPGVCLHLRLVER